MTRFLILGATGLSGILFVRKTLEVYPDASIVIYARSPEKVPEDLAANPAIILVKGTLEDLDQLEVAVQGVDVILSALGPLASHPSGTPIAIFHGHLIDLMDKYNILRAIILSTSAHEDPNDKFSLKYAAIRRTIKTVAYNAYVDVVATGKVVLSKGADLDYTLVRIPVLTNADSEDVIAGYIGDGRTGTTLSRKAFAAFVVGEVEKREWVKKAPLISNA